MRYVMQILVMLSDVIIIGAAAWLIYNGWQSPGNWVIVGLGFLVWHSQGGFMAWRPKSIRAFMRNAKKIGF